jgi:threonine dehydratase
MPFPDQIPQSPEEADGPGEIVMEMGSANGLPEDAEEDLKDEFCDPDNPIVVKFQDVSAAAYKIKSGIQRTPCQKSQISSIVGMDLYFKKDFLQATGSFKERGARNTLLTLSDVRTCITPDLPIGCQFVYNTSLFSLLFV